MVPLDHPLRHELLVRVARLNCVSPEYSRLWQEAYDDRWKNVSWAPGLTVPNNSLEPESAEWSLSTPLILGLDRAKAMNEVDCLVGIMLGVPIDDLLSIYRTQFPVLRGYEQNDVYDAIGRKVPGEMNKQYRKRGEDLTLDERTWQHPQSGVEYVFELPFRRFDREEDMRTAYAHFEGLLAEKS